jgi:hypothetical protein
MIEAMRIYEAKIVKKKHGGAIAECRLPIAV